MPVDEKTAGEIEVAVESSGKATEQQSYDRVEGEFEDKKKPTGEYHYSEPETGDFEDRSKETKRNRGSSNVGGEEFDDPAGEGEGEASVEHDGEEEEVDNDASDPDGDEYRTDESDLGDGSGKPGDYLLTKAVQAGMSLEDAKSFGTEDSLLRIVTHLEGQQQEVYRANEERLAASREAGKVEPKKSVLNSLPKLNPDDHDPELIKSFDAMKSVIEKQQEQLEKFQENQAVFVEQGQRVDVASVEQWFEGQVEALGEDFAEALGKGAGRSLTQGSSQLAKRDELAQQMTVLLAGYNATGIEPPPRDRIFEAAIKVVLPKERAYSKRRSIGDKLKKRSSQHVPRVSGNRTRHTTTPEAAAAAAIDKKFGS